MPRAKSRRTVSSGLIVAVAAAIGLHALASLALNDRGWPGSGGSTPPRDHRGGGGDGVGEAGLRVRLASWVAPPSGAAESEAISQALVPELASIESEPPAAGGVATLASNYLPAEQLDQGPTPEPGWILDEAALEQVGRASLRLRLWVSEKGRIDRVAVLHAEPPGDWVDHALRPLPSTPMRPAERDGRAVASTTVVELTANLETMR